MPQHGDFDELTNLTHRKMCVFVAVNVKLFCSVVLRMGGVMGLRDVELRIRGSRSLMPVTVMALSLAVFLFVPHAPPAVAQSMAIPGKFDVSGSGAATYSIPIAVPPGTAGMTPALALSFSSQGSNGIVGVGWSLSGLPSINRCPQTFAQDGVRGGVNFDANDRFCLDGQRLVAISGAYGAHLTEYRTEIESFTRIISHGTTGTGPRWFEVHTKSGQIMEFGGTTDSQVLAQGKTTARSWAVNKVSDTKGNYYTVTYTNDTTNGQAYPIEIDYTGNAAATPALAPYNKVQFVYATRPDITPAYQAGSLVKTTVRLTNVQTYAGTSLVADYRLAYNATITNLSSLTSVTVCAADGSCLPPTSFTATIGSGGTFNEGAFTYPNGWNFGAPPSYNGPPIVGDFNGDGKTDFAFWTGTGVDVFLSNGDGTFAASTFAYSNSWYFGARPGANVTLIVGDFNGDGKTDFAFAGANAVNVFLSKGDGTFAASAFPYPSAIEPPNGGVWQCGVPQTQGCTPIVGDFNGDGRTDFAFTGGNALYVFLSNGDGTFSVSGQGLGTNFGNPPTANYTPIVGDFNGDGKTDFTLATSTWFAVFLSNGDGTFSISGSANPNGWNFGAPPDANWTPIVGDFNGDGKTDFAFASGTTVNVLLSKGDGTFSTNQFIYPNGWNFGAPPSSTYMPLVGDFNGDGKTDFAFAAGTWVAVMFSNGDGTFSLSGFNYPVLPPGYARFQVWYTPVVGDFNGDGKTDFALAGTTSIYTFQAGGPPIYQLNAVTNGLGATTAFTYQPLTNGSVYTKDTTSTYPLVDVQVPIYVVSRVDTSNGIGGTYSTTYSYAGAKADLSGLGFLGFRQTAATDLQTNVVATTNTRQDYPYIGLTASATKTLGTLTLNSTINTYQFSNASGAATVSTPSNASAPYRVSVAQSVASSSDLDGTAMPVVTTTSQYDAYGNPTQVVTSTPDGFSKTTTNTYTNDATNWFLGRLTGATVTSTKP
jgi:hypothetical protein